MPTPTYTALATITLGSSASTVTFSSIPTTGYRDLVLVGEYTCTSNTGTVIFLNFNNDSSNNSYVGMRGNGSTIASGTGTDAMLFSWATGLSTSKSNAILQIMDYSATDKHKSSLLRCNDSTLKTEALAQRWASTAAVTSVKLTPQSNTFASGSTFSLYGIAS